MVAAALSAVRTGTAQRSSGDQDLVAAQSSSGWRTWQAARSVGGDPAHGRLQVRQRLTQHQVAGVAGTAASPSSPVSPGGGGDDEAEASTERRRWCKLRSVVIVLGQLHAVKESKPETRRLSLTGTGSGPSTDDALSDRLKMFYAEGAGAAPPEDDGEEASQSKEQTPRERRITRSGEQKDDMKKVIYETLSNSDYSTLAYVISIIILIFIGISSVTFCLETMEEYEDEPATTVFFVLEVCSITIFSLEYWGKFFTVQKKWPFVTGIMNVIDLVSILPSYIEFILLAAGGGASGGGGTRILRIIRLVRVFRVLKLGGRIGKLEVVATAVMDSLDILGMLAFLLLLSLVLFSTLIYFCEEGMSDLDDDPFESIPKSFWWCMVTLMTVGYGDVVPSTHMGQVVASLTMVASVIIMALPISVIGANFTQQWILFKENLNSQVRSASLGPKFKDLQKRLRMHNAVLAEMVQNVKALDKDTLGQLESCVQMVTVDVKDARAPEVYAAAVDLIQQADSSMEDLNELFRMTELLGIDDFVPMLDAMRVQHSRLKALVEQGADLDQDVEAILDEYEGVVESLKDAPDGMSPTGTPGSQTVGKTPERLEPMPE